MNKVVIVMRRCVKVSGAETRGGGQEPVSIDCAWAPRTFCQGSSDLFRDIHRSQNTFLSDSVNSELGRNDTTVLDEQVWASAGRFCLCRPIIWRLVVDRLPGSLIRTIKFQVNDSSLNTHSGFCSCSHQAANGIIDGRCQLLRWMEINT